MPIYHDALCQNSQHSSLTDDERSSIKDGLKINGVIIEDTAASLLSVVEVFSALIYYSYYHDYIQVQANKPSYAVGASSALTFAQSINSNG